MVQSLLNFVSIHFWMLRLLPPLALIANVTLIWLIWKKTPNEMWVHSRILLQTCVIDLCQVVIMALGVKTLIHIEYDRFALYEGYFVHLFAKPHMLRLHVLWLWLAMFDIYGLAAQFMQRYLVMNRNVRITMGRYFIILLVPILATSIYTIPFVQQIKYYDIDMDREDYEMFAVERFKPFLPDQQSVLNLQLIHEISIPDFNWRVFYAYFVLACFFVTFFAIIVFTILIIRNVGLMAQNSSIDASLRQTHKQLTKNLIILAFVPVFVLIVQIAKGQIWDNTGLAHFAMKEMPESALLIAQLCDSTPFWVPLLNPFASFLTIRAYKDALLIKLQFWRTNNQITPVVPIQTSLY